MEAECALLQGEKKKKAKEHTENRHRAKNLAP